MCDILEVSETGYYRYVRSLDNPGKKDEVLSATMREVINESPFNDNYGIERMILSLAQRVIKVGKRRATRIMRENGWLHERRRRPFGLTKATTEIQEQENLIKQNFHSNEPYQKLLTDISQVVCCDGKLYISPIMDCFNGEILSLLSVTICEENCALTPLRRLRTGSLLQELPCTAIAAASIPVKISNRCLPVTM